MSSNPKAVLMRRDVYPGHGITEWYEAADGRAIYVDFNANISETMAFPYDRKRRMVRSWTELGSWRGDMTGGRAMRELGYEPVEEAEHGER